MGLRPAKLHESVRPQQSLDRKEAPSASPYRNTSVRVPLCP